MAIQFAYISNQGVVASKAYHQITNITFNLDNKINAKMTVKVFMDNKARTDKFEPLDINVVEFTMNISDRGANPLSQAYTALKAKTKLIDSKGREKSVDYTSGDVRDV